MKLMTYHSELIDIKFKLMPTGILCMEKILENLEALYCTR